MLGSQRTAEVDADGGLRQTLFCGVDADGGQRQGKFVAKIHEGKDGHRSPSEQDEKAPTKMGVWL